MAYDDAQLEELMNTDELGEALHLARETVESLELCQGVETIKDFFGNVSAAIESLEATLCALRVLQAMDK